MPRLFIDQNSEIKVDIWIAEYEAGRFIHWFSEESMIASKKTDKEAIKLELVFREPNYRDTTELADLALAMERDGSFSMSVNQVRLERVCRLLKSWNLTDEKGKPKPPTRQNVETLHPFIAFAIASSLEDRLGVTVPIEENTNPSENI